MYLELYLKIMEVYKSTAKMINTFNLNFDEAGSNIKRLEVEKAYTEAFDFLENHRLLIKDEVHELSKNKLLKFTNQYMEFFYFLQNYKKFFIERTNSPNEHYDSREWHNHAHS